MSIEKTTLDDYKNIDQDAGENSGCQCSCKSPNAFIAYDSFGVLKCTENDCAYYMENVLEVLIDFYS
tara:strand:- start:5459 stop:5659 length:201 start_codon:yes stop_codon:yes gene_type:complete